MNKCQICAFFMFYQIIPYEYFRAHLTFVANISSALCICKMVSYARMVRWWIDLMLLFASSIRFKKTLLTVKLHFRQYTWQRTCVNIDIEWNGLQMQFTTYECIGKPSYVIFLLWTSTLQCTYTMFFIFSPIEIQILYFWRKKTVISFT